MYIFIVHNIPPGIKLGVSSMGEHSNIQMDG